MSISIPLYTAIPSAWPGGIAMLSDNVTTEVSSAEQRDRELVYQAKENVDAFGQLVELYEQPLLRYILRISSLSKAEAEEVLQEVFIAAWTNIHEFDSSL